MSKAYWDKRAQQNRQKRAQNKANQWNKGKLNRTQRNYVAGDYKASASDRAYGYRKNKQTEQKYFQTSFTGGRSKSNYAKLQRGENPYEAKYFYDGVPRTVKGGTRADGSKYKSFTSRKRYLTNDEKEAYKQTGDINIKKWKKNYKYQLLDGVDSDGKNFRSNLNLTNADGSIKWDGMNVARNRVKAGGSKWNYVGGFLKDTVGDFIFDSAKVADRYFGSALQGTLGVAETIGDLADTVTGKGKLSQVNFRQGLDNFKSSIKESDETGWAKSSSQTLKEANARQDLKNYEYLLRTKGQASADAYMESVKKAKPVSDVLEGVAGFGIDVLNPLDMTDRIKGATKIAKNNAIKSAKEIVTGTGSQAVAFLPKSSQELYEVGLKHKDMLERMKAYKKYLQEEYIPKFGNKIDDEKAWKLFENSSQAEEYAQNFGYMANNIDQTINHSLDNGFNRAMGKAEEVKEVVKSNPATQNLGRFLDEIGTNIDNGVQKHIDGRKLNAKRTQTKDGYVPQLMRGTDEVADVMGEVNPNQMSFDDLSRLENKFESIVNNNSVNDVFNYIDELDDIEADEMLDWLKDNNKSLYNRYMRSADTVDDFANSGISMGNIKSKAYDNDLRTITNANYKGVKPKYNSAKTDAMKEENVIEKLLSIFSDKKEPITYKNNIERKNAFGDYINKFADDIFNGKVDIEDLSKTVQEVMGKDVPTNVKREFINNKLFEGNNVIASNVGNSSIDGFLESLNDIANLKRVVNEYLQTGEILPVKLSSATKEFLGLTDDVNIIGSKIQGTKIESPEDLLRVLNNSILNRSRALTDERYTEKLQLMGRIFGYDNFYKEIDEPIKKLTQELRNLPNTKETLNRRLEISDNLKRLKGIKADRDKMWQQLKNLPENNFDKIISEKYPEHMKGMKPYSHKAKQGKELEHMAKGSDNALNDVYNKMFDEKMEKARLTFNDVVPEEPEKSLEVAINKKAKKLGFDNKSLMEGHKFKREMQKTKRIADYHEKVIKFAEERGLKLPERTNVKVKLAKNQTLGSLPPVKNNLDGLKKLIKKEVEEMYTDPELYAKNKTMYDAVKKDYIKGLRSYGVPDNVYFEKAKNLKKLEEEIFQSKGYTKASKKADEVSKPIDLVRQKERDELLKKSTYKEMSEKEIHERKLKRVKEGKEGGSGTPKDGMKMNLQLLASKIDEMFDDLGKADIDTLSKTVGDAKNVSNTPLDDLAKVKADDSYNPFSKFTSPFDGFTKEGEEIKLPDNYTVNQATGEVEDLSKYILGSTEKANPNFYDEVEEAKEQVNQLKQFEDYLSGKSSKTLADELDKVGANLERPTKAPSKEIQKLIDYVEEEKLFSDFNESIGNDKPSFEKFKEWFNDGSKVAYNDNKVYDLYKRWLNSWKKGLTIYNPGWHVKNFFQNKGQSYLGIGADAFKSQKNAREMFKNMKGLENSAKGILQKNGTYYSPEELTKIAKRSGVINGFNDLVKESRGLIPPLETAVDNSWLMKKLSMSEETARLHHFLTKIERGATPEEAVKSVNKYLFDYSKQNKFDRFMSDFVDPFWTYHKNNAKLVSETGITSPIRTSNILRGTRGLEHGLDEKDKANEQKRDLQAPFGHFVDKKNKDRYTYQYNMDLFPSLEEFAPIEKDDVMSKLNPLIKLAIQHKDGEGNFGNKVVDKKEADWGEVTKDERKLEILKEVNPFMNPLVKAYYKSKEHQERADKGKQSQETSDKQILMDWLEYILGNKGNYYRDVR